MIGVSSSSSAGAACYVKSLSVSPAFVLQASAELQELVEETGEVLPDHGEVDAALARADIPVAPTEEVLEALGAGAVAATDAGVFVVAPNSAPPFKRSAALAFGRRRTSSPSFPFDSSIA